MNQKTFSSKSMMLGTGMGLLLMGAGFCLEPGLHLPQAQAFPPYQLAEVTSADVTPQQRLRNLLEEIELADQLGLEVFGVGEHHRPDYAVSSPVVALAAAETVRAG